MLGRRRPVVAFLAALGFGLAEATQIRLQTIYPDLPYQFLVILPYLAAIAALVIGHARRGVKAAYTASPMLRSDRLLVIARSIQAAARNSFVSSNCEPMSWMPTGSMLRSGKSRQRDCGNMQDGPEALKQESLGASEPFGRLARGGWRQQHIVFADNGREFALPRDSERACSRIIRERCGKAAI